MSIQWTLIAGFLYVEIGTVLLLLVPFIAPQRWQRIFKSRFLRSLENQSYIYFNVFIVVLVLFFMDAIREMKKYNHELNDVESHGHLDAEIQAHMRLFRAQRNFYISGFALFLWLVLRRLVTLITTQATLSAANEAAMRQAVSATNAAQKLINEADKLKHGEAADNRSNDDREITELKEKLRQAREDASHAQADLESMRAQSESVSREYDRLLAEHSALQQEVDKLKGEAGDTKKDD